MWAALDVSASVPTVAVDPDTNPTSSVLVTTSKALVTSSDALVPSSLLLVHFLGKSYGGMISIFERNGMAADADP